MRGGACFIIIFLMFRKEFGGVRKFRAIFLNILFREVRNFRTIFLKKLLRGVRNLSTIFFRVLLNRTIV